MTRLHHATWLFCAMLAGAAACLPIAHGAFAPGGYTSGYGYDIAYRPQTQLVLPAAWSIDNYRRQGADWIRKDNGRYITRYDFDIDGDDRIDDHVDTFTFALRYEHTVHSGVLWLRNIPISAKLRNKDLRVLMQSYIDEITVATYETVRLATMSAPVVVERRQAAAIISEGPAMIAGRPAYIATIDVADVDQIKLAPNARARRVELVLMRSPQDERIERAKQSTLVFPVVVLAGYSNMPVDFQRGLEDFHDFLGRLRIGGQSGLSLTAPAAPAAPPAQAAPPAAPPAESPRPAAAQPGAH